MRITIVAYAQEISFEVGPQEQVLLIKRKIQNFLGIPVSSQILSIFDWELLDELDMEDYPIVTENTKITLTLKKPVHIIIKLTSGEMISLDIDNTETVRSLKEKIHMFHGDVPLKKLILYHSGVELEDEFRSLSEYGVKELSEIVVFSKTSRNGSDRRVSFVVQAFSSLLNGIRVPVEIKDSSNVSEVKETLMNMKMFPVGDYLFIHKQKIMRDNCSLKWHGVEDGDTLFVFNGTLTRGTIY